MPCIEAVGDAGWCEGHREVAAHVRAWARSVPPWWADAVVLWWVATGEVRPGPGLVGNADELPGPVRVVLPAGVVDE